MIGVTVSGLLKKPEVGIKQHESKKKMRDVSQPL
jgi:hypothetical protein